MSLVFGVPGRGTNVRSGASVRPRKAPNCYSFPAVVMLKRSETKGSGYRFLFNRKACALINLVKEDKSQKVYVGFAFEDDNKVRFDGYFMLAKVPQGTKHSSEFNKNRSTSNQNAYKYIAEKLLGIDPTTRSVVFSAEKVTIDGIDVLKLTPVNPDQLSVDPDNPGQVSEVDTDEIEESDTEDEVEEHLIEEAIIEDDTDEDNPFTL